MVNLETMDFKSYLERNAKQIDEELDRILSEFLQETKKVNIKLVPFALGLLNSCKGGKRIRGTLVKLGYEIANQSTANSQQSTEIIRIGAALEILHTGLLIHDDIMDKGKMRRGQPTLYMALGGNHIGISQAISVGDIALHLPIKIISDSNFLGEYKLKTLSYLSQAVINTGWGQIMDIEKKDIEFIRRFKTAKYTVSAPLQIGAILAGVDEELLYKLGQFGESLGIAFQIQDDILDGEASEKAKTESLEYIFKAKKIIPKLTKDKKMSTLLNQLAEYMVERKK